MVHSISTSFLWKRKLDQRNVYFLVKFFSEGKRFPFLAQVLSAKRIFSKGFCEAKKFLERKCFIYPLPISLVVMEMAEVVVKVPEKMKERMSKIAWIDWSSIATKAMSERLEDIEELEMRRKVAEISEIAEDDDREVKESVCEAVVKSIEETIKSGKKPMSLEELDKLMGL
ncbi:MAG TPA: hypothetical protein C5S37_01650 [Methanophagales archaeon]|nr:hypothetical protein [Methanophagales archaeon]